MAIVINGSGTITGVSAGGLPDGCVTADDLATTLDLSGNTITLPSGTGGKVLQVVQDTDSTPRDTTSTTMQDTGLSLSITPSSTSSKILIMVSQAGCYTATGGDYQMRYHLFKNGSEHIRITDVNGMTTLTSSLGWSYLDSPATTSAITYSTKFATRNSGFQVFVNYYGSTTVTSTIIAMEIAG